MGYLTQEHPNFACVETLEQTLKMNWFDSNDRESIEQSGNTDLIQMLAEMNKEKIIVKDKVQIPITIERGSLKVSADGKYTFDTPILYVYVPRRFRAAATQLSDRAVLEKNVSPTMIPFSLSKSDPMIFYDQMARHHQFLDEHKNIQIQDVRSRLMVATQLHCVKS
jgi:hypothetical protein